MLVLVLVNKMYQCPSLADGMAMLFEQFDVFAVPAGGEQTDVPLTTTVARPQLLCCKPWRTSAASVLANRKQIGAVPVMVFGPELPPDIVWRSVTVAVPQ